jgi:hypothetical protein
LSPGWQKVWQTSPKISSEPMPKISRSGSSPCRRATASRRIVALGSGYRFSLEPAAS